jgi:hypothetical protein
MLGVSQAATRRGKQPAAGSCRQNLESLAIRNTFGGLKLPGPQTGQAYPSCSAPRFRQLFKAGQRRRSTLLLLRDLGGAGLCAMASMPRSLSCGIWSFASAIVLADAPENRNDSESQAGDPK